MVTLSFFLNKDKNLNPRKKKFSLLLLKVEFSYHKLLEISIFSNKLNFFFLGFKFWFFFARQLKVTILDCCINLNSLQIFWLCWELWICVLMVGKWPTYIKIREKFVKFANFCVSGLFQWWSSSTSNSRPSISNSN